MQVNGWLDISESPNYAYSPDSTAQLFGGSPFYTSPYR